jgi:hypothetical protein
MGPTVNRGVAPVNEFEMRLNASMTQHVLPPAVIITAKTSVAKTSSSSSTLSKTARISTVRPLVMFSKTQASVPATVTQKSVDFDAIHPLLTPNQPSPGANVIKLFTAVSYDFS